MRDEQIYTDRVVPIFEAYKRYWKNAFNFQGRARRSEYWWPKLINGILAFLIVFMSAILISLSGVSAEQMIFYMSLITTLILVLTIVPDLSLTMRRLHDVTVSNKVIIPYLVIMLIYGIISIIADFYGINITTLLFGHNNQVLQVLGFIFVMLYVIFSVYVFIKSIQDSAPDNQYGLNRKKAPKNNWPPKHHGKSSQTGKYDGAIDPEIERNNRPVVRNNSGSTS